ncbi:hypothetical protein BD779DRAFT_1475043 [Infundibulicybe gibba]|nr:hypothetical protein BD779DRAFT_1475043 [Infundibulicybe gibba]
MVCGVPRNYTALPYTGPLPRPPPTDAEKQVVSDAIAKCKTQIESWMHWNTGKITQTSQKLNFKEFGTGANLKKRSRAPQRIERIEPRVQEEIQLRGARSCSERMAARRSVIINMLEAEDQETHQIISAEISRIKGLIAEEDELGLDKGPGRSRTNTWSPLEYHHAVRKLPEYLNHSLQAAADATGWVIFAAAAGPNPSAHGKIFMEQYCFGPKLDGQTFLDAYAGNGEAEEEHLRHALVLPPQSPPYLNTDSMHQMPASRPDSPSHNMSQLMFGGAPGSFYSTRPASAPQVLPSEPYEQSLYSTVVPNPLSTTSFRGGNPSPAIVPPRFSPRKYPYRDDNLSSPTSDADPGPAGLNFNWGDPWPTFDIGQKMDSLTSHPPNHLFSNPPALYSTPFSFDDPSVNSHLTTPYYLNAPHANASVSHNPFQPQIGLPTDGVSHPTMPSGLTSAPAPFIFQPTPYQPLTGGYCAPSVAAVTTPNTNASRPSLDPSPILDTPIVAKGPGPAKTLSPSASPPLTQESHATRLVEAPVPPLLASQPAPNLPPLDDGAASTIITPAPPTTHAADSTGLVAPPPQPRSQLVLSQISK